MGPLDLHRFDVLARDPFAPQEASSTASETAGSGAATWFRFDGWAERSASKPTIIGDRPYPGNAGDQRAVAQAIANLLLD